ncbi:tetrapyrrole biosynthesis, uroporphyrinogen III synthase [Clohesyomyces aquaticus]|uniref:Tetrapyrrole biosynthesis, uroporphyrinogen III synthase n=1 Tax=Clohesyomyces aquaticus TaxID=1231657 RepID=A0A1Y1Z256_9PLEO|nr:tetrapyrrole biosynthesis, uroporphyrinogen III synthase [Clohesyomyces aquaticus]
MDKKEGRIPILLLKTKSEPADGYEEYFTSFDNGSYSPVFVPVLEHRFKPDALGQVRDYIIGGSFLRDGTSGSQKYGAMIFTSQRAVEAFTKVVDDIRSLGSYSVDQLLPHNIPFYVVGPATARGLRALDLRCPIIGEGTGNGDALSAFILEHYSGLYPEPQKPTILFLVGDKRRDIIPRTLQSESLSPERRSQVHELVIYETGEMRSFKSDFTSLWSQNKERGVKSQWVVVFSPTGCRAMLEGLGLLDVGTGKAKPDGAPRDTLIATIGPTTRDYLGKEFAFTPDVCAETPSAEGIAYTMAGTRSSTRNAAGSSPNQEEKKAAGTKRKAEPAKPSPESKRGKKAAPTKQATIEETINAGEESKDAPNDIEMKEAGQDGEGPIDEHPEASPLDGEVEEFGKDNDKKIEDGDDRKLEAKDDGASSGTSKAETDGKGPVEESSQREQNMVSNILEKGIIYFFTRNRVGIEDADSVGDLQRTFFVLRPLPAGAKLNNGALLDLKNNRLLALPKKVFPKSHSDRFMAFVEKANTTIQDLKDNFFKGSTYETKTAGTRHNEPVTIVAEGVYAITRTEDRSTHLAYATTIPAELGEIQDDLGIRSQGSFLISVKNPERKGPASASLPQGPGFPKEIIEEFRGLAWSEVKPNYLDYPNCQILLIGEKTEKAVEPTTKDKKHDKETPMEEIEQLEHEDELRVQHLNGDDSVFVDLQISKKDYPKVPTTW